MLKRKQSNRGGSQVTLSGAELLARGDVEGLLAASRATFGDAQMRAGDPANPPAPVNPPAPAPPAPASVPGAVPPGYVSQETVNATVARETAAAKQKAEQDIATALGVTVEEAKQIVADRKAADDAKRTDAERAADAWKTAQEGAEGIKRAAEQERHDAKVERELQRAGFDITNATLLPAAMAAVAPHAQVGADEAAVKAAVEKVKTDAPQLFGTAPNPNPAPHSAPPNPNPNPQAPASAFGQKGHESAVRDFGEDKVKEAEARWGRSVGVS